MPTLTRTVGHVSVRVDTGLVKIGGDTMAQLFDTPGAIVCTTACLRERLQMHTSSAQMHRV